MTIAVESPHTPFPRPTEAPLVPPETLSVRQFFERNSMWFLLGRNPKSLSCRDAANKRIRLGKQGIPLEDELKSYFGHYLDAMGVERYVAIHCRGDRMLDIGKVRKTLSIQGCVERLATNDSLEEGGNLYGIVNPFSLAEGFIGRPVLQIFDVGVLEPRGLPDTMMTNAGERTWSVEFRPRDVIEALGEAALVADVTEFPIVRREISVPIGIITGNAPDSGILLWQHVNRRVQVVMGSRFSGDLSYPPVFVRSVPGLGLSMELDRRTDQVWEQLEPAVLSLCREGARLIGLACHTNHYFTERIRSIASQYGASFISVAETVAEWVEHNQISELTLVGISYVSELGLWSAYRDLPRLTRVEPLSDLGLERIHTLGYQVKQRGVTEAGRNQLRSILDDEARTSHVVIALTEISILLDSQRKPGKSGRIIVDALKLYGEKIADAYIGLTAPRELG